VHYNGKGSWTHSYIARGLTEIINANIGDLMGRFHTGLFQLLIGMERTAKLAFIVDYMIDNNDALAIKKPIRDFGRDLERLYKAVQEGANRRFLDVNWSFDLQ
jgi:hypothetical protein